MREQISLEWIKDLELVAAENHELERHRDDAMGLDEEAAQRDRKMVFDHGEPEEEAPRQRPSLLALALDVVL